MLNPFTVRKILKKGTPGTATIIAMSMPDAGASSQNIAMTLQVRVEGMNPYEVEDQWMVNRKHTIGFGVELPVKVDPGNPQKVAIDWDAADDQHAAQTAARRAALAAEGPVGGSGISDPLAGQNAGFGMGAMGAMGAMGGAMGGAFSGGTPQEPVLDLRNDPELREKLEKVVGHELVPGTTERLDFSSNPQMAAQVMQVIAQHQAEKQMAAFGDMAAGAGAAPAAGGDPLAQLERLDALRQSGALSQEEFDQQKKRLLG
jgi:hypothetical protein